MVTETCIEEPNLFPGGPNLMQSFQRTAILCFGVALGLSSAAQHKSPLATYIKEDAPVLVLDHVRVIDGTGAAPRDDVRIVIEGSKITAIQDAKSHGDYPANAKVLDLTGKTVIPGLVGMHEHLFYPLPDRPADGLALYAEAADSAPRLYLAGGVTTARTGGSLEPYTDLELKRAIEAGKTPGPKLDITGPYLEGKGTFAIQMHQLSDPDDAARLVDYWAGEGVTSFKAYNYLTADELKAAIDHAHAHSLKVTGHLCSIGFRQAAALGIDNLEHGLVVDTEFLPDKKPDQCPSQRETMNYLAKDVDIEGAPVREMIADLVAHHVAITSTLAIFETMAGDRPPMERESAALKTLNVEAAKEYLTVRASRASSNLAKPYSTRKCSSSTNL